jgi:hypothetical protein
MQRAFPRQESQPSEGTVRYFILWLLGVPISVLVLLWAFNIV